MDISESYQNEEYIIFSEILYYGYFVWLTGECPKLLGKLSRNKIEKRHSSGEFGRISGRKRSFSVYNELLHLGILRLKATGTKASQEQK